MAELNKKSLEHLAGLARLELNPQEEEKLLKDLQLILDHFKELQEADTKDIEPLTAPRSSMMTGVPATEGLGSGTDLKNVLREDKIATSDMQQAVRTDIAKGSEAFPESHEGYLKVPPVF